MLDWCLWNSWFIQHEVLMRCCQDCSLKSYIHLYFICNIVIPASFGVSNANSGCSIVAFATFEGVLGSKLPEFSGSASVPVDGLKLRTRLSFVGWNVGLAICNQLLTKHTNNNCNNTFIMIDTSSSIRYNSIDILMVLTITPYISSTQMLTWLLYISINTLDHHAIYLSQHYISSIDINMHKYRHKT